MEQITSFPPHAQKETTNTLLSNTVIFASHQFGEGDDVPGHKWSRYQEIINVCVFARHSVIQQFSVHV